MVRGRSVGFITSSADNRTIAHELGHGVFGLEHTFPEIEQTKSNNLMDYVGTTNAASNTHLTHEQWKIIHARKPAYSWFDKEEDGENKIFTINLHKFRNLDNTTASFLTPAGNIISIPYKRVVHFELDYGTVSNTGYTILENISGSLVKFRLKNNADTTKTTLYTYGNGKYLDSLTNDYTNDANFDYANVNGFVYPLSCEQGTTLNKFEKGELLKYTLTDETAILPAATVLGQAISSLIGPTPATSSPPPLKFDDNIEFLVQSNVKLFTNQPIIPSISTSFASPKDCYWCTTQATLDMNTPYKGSHLYLYVDKIAQIRNVYPEYFKKFTSNGADWLFPFDEIAGSERPYNAPPILNPNFLNKPWLKHIALQYIALGGGSSITRLINEDYTTAKNRFVDKEALILKFLRDFNAFVETSNVSHTTFWANFSTTTPLADLENQILQNETNFNLGNVAIEKKKLAIRRLLNESNLTQIGPIIRIPASSQLAVIRMLASAKDKSQATAIIIHLEEFERTPPYGTAGTGIKFIWDSFTATNRVDAIIVVDALIFAAERGNLAQETISKSADLLTFDPLKPNDNLPQVEANLMSLASNLSVNYYNDNYISVNGITYAYDDRVLIQAAGVFSVGQMVAFKNGEVIQCTALLAALIDEQTTYQTLEKAAWTTLDLASCALALVRGAKILISAASWMRKASVVLEVVATSTNLVVNALNNGVISQKTKGMIQIATLILSAPEFIASIGDMAKVFQNLDDEIARLNAIPANNPTLNRNIYDAATAEIRALQVFFRAKMGVAVNNGMGAGTPLRAINTIIPNTQKYTSSLAGSASNAPSIIKATNNLIDQTTIQKAKDWITSGNAAMLKQEDVILVGSTASGAGYANTTQIATLMSDVYPQLAVPNGIRTYDAASVADVGIKLLTPAPISGVLTTWELSYNGQALYMVTFAAQVTNTALPVASAVNSVVGVVGANGNTQALPIPQTQNNPACLICPARNAVTCTALNNLNTKTNKPLGIQKLCAVMPADPSPELITLVNELNSNNYTPVQAAAFLEQIVGSGVEPARHISHHINGNFGVEQLKAWKKLHTSGFETDFEYIRTLVYVEHTQKQVLTVTINGVNAKDVTLTHNSLITRFDGDTIRAQGGIGKGSDKGTRNHILNIVPLIRSVAYITTNPAQQRYIKFITDTAGRVKEIDAQLEPVVQLESDRRRDGSQQTTLCKQLKNGFSNDDGGHIIASLFDGTVEQINYFPQSVNTNRGPWKNMETEWKNQRNAGVSVHVNIKVEFTAGSNNRRPIRFEINYEYNNISQPSRPILNP